MLSPNAPLFKPFLSNNLILPNRVVMAPMTRSFSPGGVPGADVAAYYRRRAENGVGLIITEGTLINHPAATNDPRVPRFHGADALAGWANVVAAVHAAGGKIMPQIWHIGTV
ncbi:MAG: 12-oxophytodienoate reductase, partial [Burkholderiales bacterium]